MDELQVIQTEAAILKEGLDQAQAEYNTLEEYRQTLLSIKEYEREITIASNSLKKLNRALKVLGINHLHTLDTIYSVANDKDNFMTETVFEHYPHDRHKSGIQLVCEKLSNTMQFSLEEIEAPGKGNARRQGKKYISAIRILEKYFLRALPANKISLAQDSKFYKYVELWFINCAPNAGIQDYRRHIKNAINSR